MQTELLMIGPDETVNAGYIARAARVIREGGLVGMPTETVYGLAASAFDEKAAEKVYAAKGRPSDNPLIVHIAYPEEAETIAFVPPVFYKLAEKFMPGPLTVILPKRSCVPDGITGGLDTVAIRCPSHPVAHALIREAGVPIAAPSANRSGRPSPTTAQHVLRDMDGRIEMILDGGPSNIGLESTVIRLTEDGCVILRPGAVTERMLAAVLGTVTVARGVIDLSEVEDKPLSPGMKYKHYAPNAEVILLDGDADLFANYVRSHIADGEAVLAADDMEGLFSGIDRLSTGSVSSAEEESRQLFASLRLADDCGYRRIFIKLPPAEGEHLALYNRLIRAAGGKIIHLTK